MAYSGELGTDYSFALAPEAKPSSAFPACCRVVPEDGYTATMMKEPLVFQAESGISMSAATFFTGIVSPADANEFSMRVLQPLAELFTTHSDITQIFARGSYIPTRMTDAMGEFAHVLRDSELTDFYERAFTVLPEIGNALGISVSMFKQNVDLQVNIVGDVSTHPVTRKLMDVLGIEPFLVRDFLATFTVPGTNILVQVINPYLEKSLSEVKGGVLHIHPEDRRYMVSRTSDAAVAEIGVGPDGKANVFVSNANIHSLLHGYDFIPWMTKRPLGPQMANLARIFRLNATLNGITKDTIPAYDQRRFVDNIRARDSFGVVDDDFDRNTLRANLMALLYLAPRSFAQTVNHYPYVFAYNRLFTPQNISPDGMKSLEMAVSHGDMDDTIHVLYALGLISRRKKKHTDRIIDHILTSVSSKMGVSTSELQSRFFDAANAGGGIYHASDIRSFILPFVLFDSQNTCTGALYEFNPLFFQIVSRLGWSSLLPLVTHNIYGLKKTSDMYVYQRNWRARRRTNSVQVQ